MDTCTRGFPDVLSFDADIVLYASWTFPRELLKAVWVPEIGARHVHGPCADVLPSYCPDCLVWAARFLAGEPDLHVGPNAGACFSTRRSVVYMKPSWSRRNMNFE